MSIKSVISRELQDCDEQLEKLEDSQIRTRIRSCLHWFTEKAVKNKYCFYILSIITFMGPILINIFMVFSEERLEIKLLSSVVSACAALAAYLLQLFDVRRKWRIYRTQAEMIKSKLSLFDPENTGCEKNLTGLLKEIEKDMDRTQEEWMMYFKKND